MSEVTTDPTHEGLGKAKENGQNEAYLVLSEEERGKGFIRPYRSTYKHVGMKPKYPTRDLTPDELERYEKYGYILFEAYPESDSSAVTGRFWTREQLGSGCGSETTMSREIAETYARDPAFYNCTFCVHCGTHINVNEFIWLEDGTRVGT